MTSIIYGPPKRIESLAEYVECVVNKPHNNSPETVELQFFYRGHSNVEYKLMPSIARYTNSIKAENRLIELACNKRPETFNSQEDRLTLLAKMQHYGIPTRLIDFTLNPLVALFFACRENKNKDGTVIEINNHRHFSGSIYPSNQNLLFEEEWNPDDWEKENNYIRNYNWAYYSYYFVKNLFSYCIDKVPNNGMTIASLIKDIEKKEWFSKWSIENNFKHSDEQDKELSIASLFMAPTIIETQEKLERQRLQQGVYLLIPNMVKKNDSGEYMIKKELPELYHDNNGVGQYIIEAKNKKRIVEELYKIGINEAFLFSDSIDHVCRQIGSSFCLGEEIKA